MEVQARMCAHVMPILLLALLSMQVTEQNVCEQQRTSTCCLD
jgi:hypothetical protein